jgi:hypothetical protein
MNYRTLFAGNDSPDYYPDWICSSCGNRYGRRLAGIATWHFGQCGLCGTEASVTEPRDWGHLRDGWREQAIQDAGTK